MKREADASSPPITAACTCCSSVTSEPDDDDDDDSGNRITTPRNRSRKGDVSRRVLLVVGRLPVRGAASDSECDGGETSAEGMVASLRTGTTKTHLKGSA